MSKSIEELKVSMFKQGDYVFLKDEHYTYLYVVTNILDDGRIEIKTRERGYPVPTSCWGLYYGYADGLRLATKEEIAAGKRLDGNNAIQK